LERRVLEDDEIENTFLPNTFLPNQPETEKFKKKLKKKRSARAETK
jgi:hypothetical protein